ncbi:hypothetical protein J6590_099830 [Homalodisca vitripennis]|nr:hypothetical protein J6590_099830 [Homalodisca vitripennis]
MSMCPELQGTRNLKSVYVNPENPIVTVKPSQVWRIRQRAPPLWTAKGIRPRSIATCCMIINQVFTRLFRTGKFTFVSSDWAINYYNEVMKDPTQRNVTKVKLSEILGHYECLLSNARNTNFSLYCVNTSSVIRSQQIVFAQVEDVPPFRPREASVDLAPLGS